MPLPTERLPLNKSQNEAIRSGLDRVLNGFAELQAGLHPYSPEVLYPKVRDKFMPRALDEQTHGMLLDLRNRLKAVSNKRSSSHRLTCIEIAALMFAARIGQLKSDKKFKSELQHKLEIYRKRAKRKAISQVGREQYKYQVNQWELSVRWIRFHILPLRQPRVSGKNLRMRREQYQTMCLFANEVLSERCTELPPPDQIKHIVELAIAEIRRKRHPGIKVRELIQDPPKARQFLFEFIQKRMEKRGTELQLKFEYLPWCVQAAMRTEKYKALMVIEDDSPAAEVPTKQLPMSSPYPEHPAQDPLPPVAEPQPAPQPVPVATLPSPQANGGLINALEGDYWETVIADARHQRALTPNQQPSGGFIGSRFSPTRIRRI